MAIDFAPEFGIKYTLTGPDGTIAVFNDSADPNYVGVLTNLQGLDSAEVRESGEAIVAFDGGVQGPNYFGRRPIVIEGLCYGHTTAAARAAKLAKLTKATTAMRGDATLAWTPSGTSTPVYLKLRRQQPLRIEGGWNKTFQASMIAADPRVYSSAVNTMTAQSVTTLAPVNEGNTETFPIYTLFGPFSNPLIQNFVSGLDIDATVNIVFSDVIEIDTLNRTVMYTVRTLGSRKNFYPYPSFELGSSHGFSPTSNVTLSLVTQPAGKPSSGWGTKVLKVTRTSPGVENTLSMDYLDLTGAEDVLSGHKIRGAFSYIADVAPTSAVPRLSFVWKDVSSAVISTTNVDGVAGDTPSATVWKRFTAEATAPANTRSVDVRLSFLQNHGSVVDYYVDGVTMEWSQHSPTTNGSFFDGSNPLPTHQAAWVGTTDGSASVSFTTEIDPTFEPEPWYYIINFTETSWSGLVPGVNSVATSYDTRAAGNVFKIDWRHAWL